MRAMKLEFTSGEVQEPPSVGLRTVLCIALTTYRVSVFVGSGLSADGYGMKEENIMAMSERDRLILQKMRG